MTDDERIKIRLRLLEIEDLLVKVMCELGAIRKVIDQPKGETK